MQFDWISFALGALVAAATLFFTGFVEEFGKQSAKKVRDRFFPEPLPPEPPPPPEIVRRFDAPPELADRCRWVPEDRVIEFEDLGYTFFERGTPPRRVARRPNPDRERLEWVMMRPREG